MPLLSAVVPCYNEGQNVSLFFDEFKEQALYMATYHHDIIFEILFIDDGSKDDTLKNIKKLVATNQYEGLISVRYISFSRNFGKEAALYAGLCNARGDFVATMDADMQDPPSLLPQMYDMLLADDCDNVATYRSTRTGEPPVRSWFARLFYKLINKISDVDFRDGMRDFRLMKRQMVDAIVSVTEYNRFSKGIFSWVGFETKWLGYENVDRANGSSKWSFFSLFRYSMDGFTAFSTTPLVMASVLGFALFFISLIIMLVIVVKTLAFGDPVSGWPSLACLVLFVGGLQLFCLGVVGQYLAKGYLETKRRPLFIVKDSNVNS
jgi:glucosyltransferase